jgi:hypothetical protein
VAGRRSYFVHCLLKAWHNLISTRRMKTNRGWHLFILWFAAALTVPIATLLLIPAAGPWVWLLAALATNGLVMMGFDSVPSRR